MSVTLVAESASLVLQDDILLPLLCGQAVAATMWHVHLLGVRTIVAWMAPEAPTRKHAICRGPPFPCTRNQTEVEVRLHLFPTVLDVVNRVLGIRRTSCARVDSESV